MFRGRSASAVAGVLSLLVGLSGAVAAVLTAETTFATEYVTYLPAICAGVSLANVDRWQRAGSDRPYRTVALFVLAPVLAVAAVDLPLRTVAFSRPVWYQVAVGAGLVAGVLNVAAAWIANGRD